LITKNTKICFHPFKGNSASKLAALKNIFTSLSILPNDTRIKTLKEEHLKDLGKEELDYIISILSNQKEDTGHRQLAANLLGFTGCDYGVDALLEAWNDEDFYVAMCAGIALGNLKAKKAVEPFIKTYRQKTGSISMLKMAAIDNLGRLSDLRALPVLEEAMNDQDGYIRELAISSFEHIYLEYVIGYIQPEELSADKKYCLIR